MEFMSQKSTDNNKQPDYNERTATTPEIVFAPDGTPYSVEQVAAGYGMSPNAYVAAAAGSTDAYGNSPSAEAYHPHYLQHESTQSNQEEDESALPYVGAVAGSVGIAYKTYEPFRETVDETAKIALDVGQQAYEFAGDRPLLFAGVTALGIGAAMVKVWRDVRKYKNATNQESQPYGNTYHTPSGY